MSKNIINKNKKVIKRIDDEAAVIAKTDTMKEPYCILGKRLHQIIMKNAPELKPRLWYGMPGYAKSKNTPVLIFFRADDSYMTLGLTEKVKITLEEDVPHQLMACAWFFTDLDSATEEKISDIVRKAML